MQETLQFQLRCARLNQGRVVVQILNCEPECQWDPHLITAPPPPPRTSNDCIDHLYHTVMSQLNQDHAEIRLSAFQIASQLFSRSHYFRTLLVDNFQVD